MSSARPRVLLAITVYNGRDVVPPCLRSAAVVSPQTTDVDVLVLDDASPEPGVSGEVQALCAEVGIDYYRSPRNLGIPRNVNLGLVRALEGGYDHVIIANSDVVFPAVLTDRLVAVAETDDAIGSVTAWSNNVSVYSLPNEEPDKFLGSQEVVDWITTSLYGNFGLTAVDVPAGISFCILIPTRVLREVGLMDPVFGRGYCEETDWSLRSRSLGYRVTLSPSTFVYHRGQGSTAQAGILPAGHSTVPENERIVDLRYPLFRSQVDAFTGSEILDGLRRDALRKILGDAAAQWGYRVELNAVQSSHPLGSGVDVTVDVSQGRLVPIARFSGFAAQIPVASGEDLPGAIVRYFGQLPEKVRLITPGGPLHELASAFERLGAAAEREVAYPTRV